MRRKKNHFQQEDSKTREREEKIYSNSKIITEANILVQQQVKITLYAMSDVDMSMNTQLYVNILIGLLLG